MTKTRSRFSTYALSVYSSRDLTDLSLSTVFDHFCIQSKYTVGQIQEKKASFPFNHKKLLVIFNSIFCC